MVILEDSPADTIAVRLMLPKLVPSGDTDGSLSLEDLHLLTLY